MQINAQAGQNDRGEMQNAASNSQALLGVG
jgi:hypothetical protein